MSSEPGFIDSILASVAATIADIARRIGEAVQDLFAPAINQVFSFFNGLINSLSSQLSDIGRFIDSIITQVLSSVSEVIEQVADFAQNLFDGFIQQVADVFNAVVEELQGIGQRIYDFIAGAIDQIAEFIQNMADQISMFVNAGIETVKQFAVDVFENVVGFLTNLYEQARQAIILLGENVIAGVQEVLQIGRLVVEDLQAAVQQFANEVIDEIGSTVRDLVKTIADLPEEITKLGESLLDSAEKNIAEPIKALAKQLVDEVLANMSITTIEAREDLRDKVSRVVNLITSPTRNENIATEIIELARPDSPWAHAIYSIITLIAVAVQAPLAAASINSEQIRQNLLAANPINVLSLNELATGWRRGVVPDAAVESEAARTGHSGFNIDVIKQLTRHIPPSGELINWFYRGIIDQTRLQEMLLISGFDPSDVGSIMQALDVIPPINDLITMAVREVFSPAIAESFGQFQDFPQEVATHAAKHGLSAEWAQRYWAAHWNLPSLTMGYEMLHRRIIDRETLALLMRSQDVMPFWRDKLMDLSFAPYTRVDIRRMHQVGVLNDAEVMSAHLDLGYDEDKASKLTDFVIKLNSPGGDDNPEKAKDLQQATILKFFKDGVFDENKAIELLIHLGFTTELASILVRHAAIEDAAAERKIEIDLVVEQALAGLVSFEEAANKLGSLGAERGEVDKALARIVRGTKTGTRMPTRSELDAFVKQGIISPDEYVLTLQLLGYSEKWALAFAELLGAKLGRET